MTHPTSRLDDVIHQRVRLGILAILTEADLADFTFLREELELTDGNLSRHLQVLEEAGYVRISKEFVERKPLTRVHATRRGRRALASHLSALQELIDQTSGGREL